MPRVYDSIDKDTFIGSLDCLSPLRMMVSFGNASGPIPPFSLTEWALRGSLFITRPSVFHYTARRDDFDIMAAYIFSMGESKKINVDIHQR